MNLRLALALSLAAPHAVALAAPPQKAKAVTPPKKTAQDEVKLLLAGAPKPEQWPNASKVTMHDFADVTIRPDGSSRTVTRQTIRIFAARARDEGEIKIPYNGSFETVKLLRARTIRPNGQVVEVKPADVRSAAPSDYDDAKVLSFSMPAVEPGAILDYEYVTDQKASQLPGHHWSQWYFQSGFDPVLHTRLTVNVPKTLSLRTQMRNTKVEPKKQVSADGQRTQYVWESKNLDALFTEPLMPEMERTLPKLTYSTLADWQVVAKWYDSLAEGRAAADPEIKTRALEIVKGKTTPEDKARAIFYAVQEQTRYVAIELGLSAYQPRPASQTLINQYGDCKDMATLLVAMLRSVGINAHPVLLEAGAKYKTSEELPAPSAFNHAICMAEIGGKEYWLDATAEHCAFGQIPGGDRGVEALVLKDGKGEFQTIPFGTVEDAESNRSLSLTLQPDGSATGTLILSGTGDFDLGLRAQLAQTPPDKLGNFAEAIAQGIAANATVSDVKVSNYKNRDELSKISMKVKFPQWATQSGDLLLFKARPDQTGGQLSNPLSREDRKYPLAVGASRRVGTHLEITLPDGFVALSEPKEVSLTSPLGTYARKVARSDKTLTIDTTIDDLRGQVPPSQAKEIKTYFDGYLKAYDESVILKKVAPAHP